MKRLRLTVCLIFLVCLISIMYVSSSAEWDNTMICETAHRYYNGNAECTIMIEALYEDAIIRNVDITLTRKFGANFYPVASWNDLSSGYYFEFFEVVENVSPYYVYRLAYTAEVVYNGAVDYLDFYFDVDYSTNQRV